MVDLRLSSKARAISSSMTLAITSKVKKLKAEGKSVINFAAGEPDLPTPKFVCQAAKEAIDKGLTRYTPASGLLSLKESVCKRLKRISNLNYTPEQILISCGAKHSIYNILQVLVDEGDEVIIPMPYWVSYPEMVKLAGGIPLFVETKEEEGFCLNPMVLEEVVKKHPKACVLILNYPTNPTGAVYDKKTLMDIAKVCAKYKLWVISDEIYDVLTYIGEHTSLASISEEICERTITINGVSKSYCMTGWRIGFAAGNKEIIAKASSLQSHSTSNPTTISQYAAIKALEEGAQWEEQMREIYSKRMEIVREEFVGFKIARLFPPKGTFYAFVDISNYGIDSMEFANRLLDEVGIGVIPGVAFGADSWVRVSFAASEEEIREGFSRWKKWERDNWM